MISNISGEILLRSSIDWIDLSEVAWVVRTIGDIQDQNQVIKIICEILYPMLMTGSVSVGDLINEGNVVHFAPWKSSPHESISRIKKEWDERKGKLELGDVCWVSNNIENYKGEQRVT